MASVLPYDNDKVATQKENKAHKYITNFEMGIVVSNIKLRTLKYAVYCLIFVINFLSLNAKTCNGNPVVTKPLINMAYLLVQCFNDIHTLVTPFKLLIAV